VTSPRSDSAGQPWEGRRFEASVSVGDDGSAPAEFLAAIAALRGGTATLREVVDVVRGCRFLIPLVAVAGQRAVSEHGDLIDASQELSIITVSGPDGRAILPVFSSVAAMAHWRPDARPVPADAVRVALAAASENTDRIVIDARGETELVLPRPAVWAIAQERPWVPAINDDAVLEAVARPAEAHAEVWAVSLIAGDPQGRGADPEVIVRLAIEPGLDAERLRDLVRALSAAWATDATVAERIDSLSVQPVAAPR
jgi:hypothetical protein